MYRTKQIVFGGKPRVIVLQSENGPCPLLAVANVCALRGQIVIHPDYSHISFDELLQLVINVILTTNMEKNQGVEPSNVQQSIADVIELMPRLNVGLDVNVRFRTITDFEFTAECAIFDLLDIPLVHGWLVDPQDRITSSAIGTLSYNQLVEKLVAAESGSQPQVPQNLEEGVSPPPPPRAVESDQPTVSNGGVSADEQGLAIQTFFQQSSSQLTYYGLAQLHETIRENSLCVFFRNNHFSVLLKHRSRLFLLVTDEGYLHESLTWELLSEVEGDSVFCDSDFRLYQPTDGQQHSRRTHGHHQGHGGGHGGGHRSDQVTQPQQQRPPVSPPPPPPQQGPQAPGVLQQNLLDPDFLLALNLQEEEKMLAEREQQQGRRAPAPAATPTAVAQPQPNRPPTSGGGRSQPQPLPPQMQMRPAPLGQPPMRVAPPQATSVLPADFLAPTTSHQPPPQPTARGGVMPQPLPNGGAQCLQTPFYMQPPAAGGSGYQQPRPQKVKSNDPKQRYRNQADDLRQATAEREARRQQQMQSQEVYSHYPRQQDLRRNTSEPEVGSSRKSKKEKDKDGCVVC